ncbi:hypothetical protein Tco_0092331 [Tanacetum coccineum]
MDMDPKLADLKDFKKVNEIYAEYLVVWISDLGKCCGFCTPSAWDLLLTLLEGSSFHEFNAKLLDFRLAKAGPTGDRTHVSTQIAEVNMNYVVGTKGKVVYAVFCRQIWDFINFIQIIQRQRIKQNFTFFSPFLASLRLVLVAKTPLGFALSLSLVHFNKMNVGDSYQDVRVLEIVYKIPDVEVHGAVSLLQDVFGTIN